MANLAHNLMAKNNKVDIIAVAKAAKVSPSTVSRSFNHPDLVNPATRKKIDRAVRKLGYIRNRAAQTIHGIRSGTVGLIVPTVDHAIFAELIQSFAEAIEEMGFTILLASHGYDLEREYALTRKMLEHRVDGMALIGLDHGEATYELLHQQSTPSVLLWNYGDNTRLPSIGADNFKAGQMIGRYLLDLGHRDIATVFPNADGNDRAADRFRGLMDVLASAGVNVATHWQKVAPYSVAAAKEVVEDILSSARLPTAIACGNDVLAWGVLHACARQGIIVPDQINVTGIGDFKGSREFEPSLTTVRIPARTIGAHAAQAISAIIKGEALSTDCSMEAPLELQPRSSCRRIGRVVARGV